MRNSPWVLLLFHSALASSVPCNVNTAEDPLFPIETTVCESNTTNSGPKSLHCILTAGGGGVWCCYCEGKLKTPPKLSLKSKNTLHVLVCISRAARCPIAVLVNAPTVLAAGACPRHRFRIRMGMCSRFRMSGHFYPNHAEKQY